MQTFFRILILSMAALTAQAQDGVGIHARPAWPRAVPADLSKTISAAEVTDGYYFPLLDRQINLATRSEYTHIIREVINAAGVQNASGISVRYAPQFQHLVFHQVSVIREGRVIDQLKKDRIKVVQEEEAAQDFVYHGLKRAFIDLLDVQPGDRIEYAYSLEGFNPVFGQRYSADYFFSGNTPYANYYISVISPAGRSLNVRTYNGAVQPEITVDGNTRLYRWSNPPIDLSDNKPGVPSWYTHSPYVSVTEFGSWKEVVDWGLETFSRYRFSLPATMEARISVWKKQAAGDQDVFACLALRYVQDHVRYLGLEIGTNTHKPHAPADVCVSGFGDCKDKALLLATILRHENIDASVALLNSTDRWTLAAAQPAPDQFDHAIVALKRDSGYLFVDPTISLQRGTLRESYLPAYGYALVLRPGSAGLEPVNQMQKSEAAITESVDVSAEGKGKFEVTTLYRGGPADNARSNFASSSLKALGSSFTSYYSRIYEGIGMVSPPLIKDDSLKNEMAISESYQIPHPWQKQTGGRSIFSTYVKSIDERLPGLPPDSANAPLALRYPQTVSYTLKLKMPESFATEFAAVHIRNDSYQFDFTQEESGSSLVYKYYLKTFRDHIPAAELAQFKSDYRHISDCLSFRFTRNNAGGSSGTTSAAPTSCNWTNLWITLAFGVFFTALFRFYDQHPGSGELSGGRVALGGWALVLGISLVVRLIFQAVFFEQENYFQQPVWEALFRIGGRPLLTIYVMEMIQGLWNLFGLGALIYWFVNRRDLFPTLFSYHLVILLFFQLSIPVMSYLMKIDSDAGMRSGQWAVLGETAIYSAVWITYVRRSERIRQTFVVPEIADR